MAPKSPIGNDSVPLQLGRYEIVLPIAKGGMATVYLARARGVGGFDRYLALKLTAAHLRSDPEFAAHLIEEAKLVAHLRHTNVVSAYDVGDCEHGIFLVMDYVPGDSFSGLRKAALRAGRELPRPVSMRILVDALLGLHAAHEHEDEEGHPLHLVHRDFSPQNILVGTDGIARLTDFGIAKAASRISNTAAGFIKGKLSYLAPEQVQGIELDRRCDIWSAGVIAWEVLAGRRLAGRDDASAATGKADPPRLSTVTHDVSDELDEVVFGALRMDRALRTPTAKAFGRALYTAAKTAGLIAEQDEVAEHVVRLIGPELAERKARLAEARRTRQPSVPDVRTMMGPGALPGGKPRAPLPSLPDIPVAVEIDDGASELRIEVPLDEPAHRADAAEVLGEATNIVPAQDSSPEIYRSPVVAPSSSHMASESFGTDGPSRTIASSKRRIVRTDKPALAMPLGSDLLKEGARRAKIFFAPPWTTKKLVSIGACGLVIGLIIVKLAIPSKDKSENASVLGSPSSSADAVRSAVPTTQPSQQPAPQPTPVDMGQVDPTQNSAEPSMLKVTANGPIASVRVGDRFIEAVVPAPTVTVELSDEERDKPLRLVVIATDGRFATATNEPGSLEVEVIFGKPAAPRPTTAPSATVKRPWQKRDRK